MNTKPVVFTFGDDKVQLVPEPLRRRFTIILVRKGTTENTNTELGYLGMHNFPSRTPIYLPNECSHELIKTFGTKGVGLLMEHCEKIVQCNGHVRPTDTRS